MSKYMSQTSKTILFEEFNSEITDNRLDFILRGDKDEDHIKVKERLTVRSFSEFMEKFSPKYYECTVLETDSETGKSYPVFTYKLDKPASGDFEEKDIRLQPFYKAMMTIYEDKGISGENDFKFEFGKALDKLYDPEQAMKDARSIRQQLQYHYNEYLKLESNGASDEELNYHAEEINNLKKIIKKEYITQSQFNMLPLLIQDTRERLDIKTGGNSEKGENSISESVPVKAITFNAEGNPVYHIRKSLVNSNDALMMLESKENVFLIENKYYDTEDTKLIESSSDSGNGGACTILSKMFDSTERKGTNHLVVPGDSKSTAFMKRMFLSVFAGQSNTEDDISTEELRENLQIYELMYRASQQNFAKGVVKLVEKLLNVRAFFDNAGGKAELIVSNCTLETLMNDKNREKFERFIKDEGENYTSERIWFSIIPGVWDNEFCREDDAGKRVTFYDDDDDDDDDDSAGTSSAVGRTGFNTVKKALKLIGESNIIAFFNFKGCDSTSSAKLNKDIVKRYKSRLEDVDSECKKYAVFSYPNFTVLPKRSTSVKIGNDRIQLPPVYIDSAYVSCGLYVASQNMDILRQKGFKVNTSLEQPVRFNFEGKFATSYGNNEITQLNHVFSTNMNREKIMPWGNELMNEINADGGFGFCFCGNEKHYVYKGQNINQSNAYPLHARTLQKDKILDENNVPTGEERYRPVFKTMIEIYIKKISGNISKEQLKKECKLWCEGTSKMNINNIVYSVESAGLNKSESIELNADGITVIYDRDRDDFEINFIEM